MAVVVPGSVAALYRWPVKSLAGERLMATRVGAAGLAGDRAHALVERAGRRQGRLLTARQVPGMLAWSASYPLHPDARLDPSDHPPATVRAPHGGRWSWDDPRLERALSDGLGHPVRLLTKADGLHDEPATVLITVESSRRALEEALGRTVDIRRFRPNVHVRLDSPPFAEEGWSGSDLRIGQQVVLRVVAPCERCAIPTWTPSGDRRWPHLLTWIARQRRNRFGVYARVVMGGVVTVDDPVRVVAPGGG